MLPEALDAPCNGRGEETSLRASALRLPPGQLGSIGRGNDFDGNTRLFGVAVNSVSNLLRLRNETGSLQPRPNPGGHPPAIPEDRYDEVRHLLAERPDLTLAPIRDHLGLSCSEAAVCRALKKLGLSRKKTLYAAEQKRPDVQAAREEWVEWQATLTEADLSRLVFLDEAAVLTTMTPLGAADHRGGAPSGRLVRGVGLRGRDHGGGLRGVL